MMPPEDGVSIPDARPAGAGSPAHRVPVGRWLIEGLRSGVFLRPRVDGAQPTPAQVVGLLLIFAALDLLLTRLEVAGAARFDLRAWLAPWWSTGVLVLLAWWTLPPDAPRAGRPAGLAAWFALWMAAVVPANAVSQAFAIAQARGALPQVLETATWVAWLLYLVLWAWIVAAVLRLTARFGVERLRLAALGLAMAGVFALTAIQFPDRAWEPQAAASGPGRLQLSQELFEVQQEVWEQTVATIAPQRRGVVDLYALVFSPYAAEDVFLRESSMVAAVLAERFDAADRIVHLANHAATARSLPWATRSNLERSVEALAARMDPQEDVLLVYLTSHGAGDFSLAAVNEPLHVEPVGPADLRRALDQAGIRHRVIIVSACYSGGWVAPLAGETTLVMTAADAASTSYGCGRLSELTFFGRALFDEQLRSTRSLEQAFEAAVPLIRRREVEAGKSDGFSNPQISVGEQIRPVLRDMERRLEGTAQPSR
jgi:hypothetical protein